MTGDIGHDVTGLRRITVAVVAVAVIATGIIVAREVIPLGYESGDGGPMLAMAVWLLSPYVAMVPMARWLARTRAQVGVVLAGTVVIAVVGVAAYVDAFIVNPEFLSFLVILAVPNLLWVVVLATAAVTAILRWRSRRS